MASTPVNTVRQAPTTLRHENLPTVVNNTDDDFDDDEIDRRLQQLNLQLANVSSEISQLVLLKSRRKEHRVAAGTHPSIAAAVAAVVSTPTDKQRKPRQQSAASKAKAEAKAANKAAAAVAAVAPASSSYGGVGGGSSYTSVVSGPNRKSTNASSASVGKSVERHHQQPTPVPQAQPVPLPASTSGQPAPKRQRVNSVAKYVDLIFLMEFFVRFFSLF